VPTTGRAAFVEVAYLITCPPASSANRYDAVVFPWSAEDVRPRPPRFRAHPTTAVDWRYLDAGCRSLSLGPEALSVPAKNFSRRVPGAYSF